MKEVGSWMCVWGERILLVCWDGFELELDGREKVERFWFWKEGESSSFFYLVTLRAYEAVQLSC